MKKQILSIFASIALAGVAATANAAIVALPVSNPGFESGLVDWTFNNFTITSTANSGSNAIQAGSQPIATASQTINLDSFSTEIDTGSSTLDIDYFVSGQDNFDFYTVGVEFFETIGGAGSSLGTAETVGPTAGTGGFVADTIDGGATIVPVSARSFVLTLEGNIGSAGSAIGIAFDDVSASINAVPEPSAAFLIGFGGVALLLRRRRA